MIDIIRDRTIALMNNFRRTILTADLFEYFENVKEKTVTWKYYILLDELF